MQHVRPRKAREKLVCRNIPVWPLARKKRDAGRDVHGGREFWSRGEGKVSRGGRYDKSTGICWFKGTVILNLHLANYTVVHVQHASIFLVQWC